MLTDPPKHRAPHDGHVALRIDIDYTPGSCRLSLAGELDSDTASLLGDALEDAARRRHEVVVDLREVTACDETGIDELLAARRRADAYGTRLELTGTGAFVRRAVRAVWAEDLPSRPDGHAPG